VELTPAAKAYLEQIGPLFEQLSQATARYDVPETIARVLSAHENSSRTTISPGSS
jgi:LysR family transcriptional regulator, glycine cleavage system transcriptional activator